jgi:predicted transcriptional regulator
MDYKALEDLGLSEGEVKIYLALLELGQSPAKKIIEKSGLNHSTVHRALNSLIDKGLINFIYEGNNRIYDATNPENFIDFIEDKKKRFLDILPELKKRQEFQNIESKATIFKGKAGITKVYNVMVNSKADEYNSFGGGVACRNLMGDAWWYNIHQKRLANNLKARQVWDLSVKDFLDKDFMQTEMTKIRFIDASFAQFQETVIAGKYVAITIFTESPYSILIEDGVVAQGYKKYFEIMWDNAKK